MLKLRLGVSSCLLGNPVRYDGGHKLDRFLTGTLGSYVEYLPVCPEAEAGLGVPREAMRLTGDPGAPRLVTIGTGRDLTGTVLNLSRRRLAALAKEDLDGFIFKSRSPTCALSTEFTPAPPVERDEVRGTVTTGPGLYAGLFRERFPLLPVADEAGLSDPGLRGNFIEAAFVLKRWRELLASGRSRRVLVDFQTRHKLLLMSHSVEHYRRMGALAAKAGEMPLAEAYKAYQDLLLGALRLPCTVSKQVNVLQHAAGYFKRQISAGEKRELSEAIENYRRGLAPLAAPLNLLNRHVRKHRQPCLILQHYLNPHPLETHLGNYT